MTEFCFEPGLTGQDIADALRSLSPRLAANAPVFASGGKHAVQAGKAIFASMALLRLFGANNLEDLSQRMFAGGDPGSKRLADLAANLPLGAAPRLERLRFFLGPATRSITFLCRRVGCEGAAPLFVAAAIDVADRLSGPAERVSAFSPLPPPPLAPRPAAPRAVPPLPEAGGMDEVRAMAPRTSKDAGPIRFLWRTDADDRIIEVTAPFAQVFGAAAAELVGRNFAEAVRSIARDQGERLAQILASRETWSGVEIAWPITRPIGGGATTVPVSLGASPSFDRDRRFAGYRGFGVIDIARLATASEPMPDSFDPPEPMRMGAKEANVIPLRPLAASPGRGDDAQRPASRSATAPIAFSTGAEPADADAAPGAEIDKARLEARFRAAESEARELSAILDTAMDGVAVLDAQGKIATLNRSGEALFGYDQSEVAGEPFTMLIAPDSRARARDYFEGLKANGVESLLNDGREIMGLARQGGTIPIFMTLGRVTAGADREEDVRFCALLRDMTHWKKVERELDDARRQAERASALKSDFLAKVSHEIRTPLNAILGFAEVIMEERFGPIGNERYKDYLKDIHSSGALVMSLVNDLLDLSKIEAGKMELDFASVDANRIVAECVSIMQPQASRARVIIRLALASGLPHVVADERSLRQIVLNLLSNAVKFNQPGGQVIVATALTDAGHAVLRIRDTGVGMSEADIDIALEPFRQLATSRPSGGTGLGLPLTKALVEANRAYFSITSRKHEGTLVEVAFPPARILAN